MRAKEIIKKVGVCLSTAAIITTELLTGATGISEVHAAEPTTREKIESEYTETTSMTTDNWKDSLQKNYQVSGSSDSYLIKSVEWTDIEKGEALITLAAKDKVEEYSSLAVYLFTTCTGHTQNSHNGDGLSPSRVIANVKYLLDYYDAVDCVLVDGNYDWQTCSDSGLSMGNFYEKGSTPEVKGTYADITSRALVKSAYPGNDTQALKTRYVGINPVHTFYKKDNPTDAQIGEWLNTMPWVSSGHITQSLPAALRAYLFGGDKMMDTYGDNAHAFTDATYADTYRSYIQDAFAAPMTSTNLKKRPTAIYIAGDSYIHHPPYASWSAGKGISVSENFATSYLFEESSNKDFAKFLKRYYVSDGSSPQRYFSFSSQAKILYPDTLTPTGGITGMLQAHSGSDTSKTQVKKSLTSIQCMFQPEIVADSVNEYESPCVGQAGAGKMITERMADYPYDVNFSTLGVELPPKSITIEDTIEDYFQIVNTSDIEVMTYKDTSATGTIIGTPTTETYIDAGKSYQRIKVKADNYTAGDELTVKIPVKLDKVKYEAWRAAHSSDDKLVSNHGDAVLYDGSMAIKTVNPNLALPAAQDAFKKVRTLSPTFTKKLIDEALDSSKGFTFSIVEATDSTCATAKAVNSTGIKVSGNVNIGLGTVTALANTATSKISLGTISIDATKDSDDGTDIGLVPGESKDFYFKVYETIGSSNYEQTLPDGNYYKLRVQVSKALDGTVSVKWYIAKKDQAFSAVSPVDLSTDAKPNFDFVNKTKGITVSLEATNGKDNGTVRNSDSTPIVTDQATNPYKGHVVATYGANQTVKYKGDPGCLLESVQIDSGATTTDFTTPPGSTYKTGVYTFTGVSADTVFKVKYVKPSATKTVKYDGADISSGSGKKAETGQTVTYEIKTNNPTSFARDIAVEDVLDAGLEFVSASTGGTYDSATRKISWPVESLSAGGNVTYSFKAKILDGAKGKTIPNKAKIKYQSIGAAESAVPDTGLGTVVEIEPSISMIVKGDDSKPVQPTTPKDEPTTPSGPKSDPVITPAKESTNIILPIANAGNGKSKAPKTGDETNISFYLGMLAALVLVAVAWFYYLKKKGLKSENEQEK